jgi:A/G-specific adenine glycosylase
MQSSLSSNPLQGKTPVVDIEDQCDICEPLPSGKPSVTMFPMKVEKKVVPKETDLVCVISWKRKGDPTTYYLLRKRPKTGKDSALLWTLIEQGFSLGLLAGLWDFPAIPNISSTTMKAQEKTSRELVAEAFPQVGQEGDNLDIKGCDGLGSVLHVFSHVKKTFQVVLLRLEGPSDVDTPPDAVPGDWMDDKQSEEQGEEERVIEKPSKKRKVMPVQNQGDGDDSLRLKWVLEPNVAQEKYVSLILSI